tara:strand:+ start:9521 stop:9946 length:426 start_codon:yes stop_codon:yes gene_type:complete
MAGDGKIWVAAIFMLISYVYRAYKKKNQQEEEEAGTGKTNASSGFADLLKQFQDSMNPTPKTSPVFVDDYDVISDYSNETVSDNVVDEKPEVVDESFSTSSKTTSPSQAKPYDIQEDSAIKTELDLREMIIHQAILDRPTY